MVKETDLITNPEKHLDQPLVDDVIDGQNWRIDRVERLDWRQQWRHIGAGFCWQLAVGPTIETRDVRHLFQKRKASEIQTQPF